jgi:mono/diheme cytochrome c family protein/glucose/arabinose dehydrogenase
MKRASLLSRSSLASGAAAVALAGVLIYSANAQTPPPAAPAAGAAPAAPPVRRNPLEGVDLSPKPPVPHLRPAEQAKLFQLQPGYSMTPVLADPQIEQPGAISFDANGRMYVLELRTYMLDADAKDELTPRSRISRWEDRDGDGVYETGTTFIDNLIFPRFVTPLGDGQVLTKESNSDDTFLYTDTNGDGKADKRELFVTGLGRSGNVEHQESHLTWALDNWMYSTFNAVRVRWTPNGAQKEPVGPNGAAWGVTQDDYGKVWFQNGASGLPSYFQFPILYGNIPNPDQLQDGFRVPWGAPIGIGDMQGGLNAVRPGEGSLNATTAGSGANIYRGDRLPAELKGDYFYGEVVARILRRSRPVNDGGLTQVQNPYQAQKSEFIRSMDPLFRPVDNKTAPDGTLYIVDMYHGIIQEGEWAQPGTYLRAKINQYKLDTAIRYGRIWRLTYNGMQRDTTKPRMFQDTAAKLVTYLSHPNGWWRDTAQQQLVLRQDKSVVPALKAMATANPNKLARIHAAWTLEGLGSLDAGLVRVFLKDRDPKLRAQGARLSEILYKGGDQSFAADLTTLARDADTDVSIQALLSLQYLKVPGVVDAAKAVKAANPAKGAQLIANRIITPPAAANDLASQFAEGMVSPVRTEAEVASLERGAQIFAASCGECHGLDGQGAPDGNGGLMAPAMVGNARIGQGSPEHVLRVLLSGLTDPIAGKSYAVGVMVPQRSQSDQWIADVASYLRNGLTNGGTLITPEMVAFIRAQEASRTEPYTDAELSRVQPQPLQPENSWKVSASSVAPVMIGGGAGRAEGAFTLEGWTTGKTQEAGQYWQVELPKTVNLAGLDYQALTSSFYSRPGAAPAAGGFNPRAPRVVYQPRGYKLEVSTDGKTWKTIKEGAAVSMYNSLMFAPVPARFVRITTTASAPEGVIWGMKYLKLFAKS